jgi:tetratricopeptide (TPR) repeat protein
MTRFQGFPDPEGLLRLDTVTGEVLLVSRTGERRLLQPGVAVTAAAAHGLASQPASPVVEAALTHGASEFVPADPTPLPAASPPTDPLPAGIDDLDREVVLTFPYPIARPYLDLLEEKNPKLRCKLLVDTFTSVLKVWALIVASEYLRATDVKDAQVHKTLVRDLARPLISAWSLLLQRALPVLRDAKVPPFAPELGRAFDALETKCKQRFLVTESYVDDAGQTQTRTKKLGKIQALIAYRNGLAHGFNQNAKQAQRDLDTYLPLLKEVLREARFLARYPLWHVVEGRRGADDAVGYRLMGARPSGASERVDAAELDPRVSPLFLKNEATGDVLPLFAFFDVHEVEDGGLPGLGRDVFLFEGNTKGTVIYVSATGEHAEKAARFQHWQALLAQKAVDVELLSTDTLTLDALRAASRRIADQAIEALVQSGKYLREASVDREDLRRHLETFERGKYGAFVLGGESGIGKSTLLARYVERRREAGDAVAFYRASALPSPDLAGRLLRDLGLAGMYLEDFLAAAAPLFRDGPRFLLVVDAVNEFAGDVAELVRQIDQMVQQSAGHDWFRIVVSVRDSAYQRLPADARFGARGLGRYLTIEEDRGTEKVRTPVVALGPVGAEHVEALYEAYRNYRQRDPDDPDSPGVHRFRPNTAFAELAPEGSTRALLRSPLMARLVLEAHHRRALPSDLRSDQAMRLYLDQVVVEAGSPSGGFPERRRLLTALVRELDRASTDTLARDGLNQVPALRAALLNPQRDSAYVQLVELGVLLEEWEGDTCFVRFAFDRLFEYLLAELHDPRVQTGEDALALARRAVDFRSLRGALEAIVGRACEQGRDALLTDLLDCGALEDDDGVRTLVGETAVALLVRLARDKDPSFERIVAAMPAQPSPQDVAVLCEVADRLARLGEVQAQERAIAALIAEAEALGDARLIAGAHLRHAHRLNVRGDWDGALVTFERVERAAREAGAMATVADAVFGATSIRRRRGGSADDAQRGYRDVLAIREALGDTAGIADTLRRIGVIHESQGDLAEAEQLYLRALGMWRSLGAMRGVSTCLTDLGDLERGRADNTEAERLYRESLAIDEALGDAPGMATSLNNVAITVKARGDLPEAERLYRASLAICEATGNRKWVSTAFTNLAILVETRGDLDTAERMHRQSLEIREALGQKPGIQYTHYLLTAVLAVAGRPVEEGALATVRTLGAELDTPRARSFVPQAEVIAYVQRGDASPDGLRPLLDAMRAARVALGEVPDVEDGPATPFFVAARWLHARGECAFAAELAREALAEAGASFWSYRAEAEVLAG